MPTSPTRKQFLQQAGILSAATLLSPLAGQASMLASAPEKRVRVGLIGCGSVSNMYLPHLSKSPFVELVSTCDIIPERAQQAAAKYRRSDGSPLDHYPHIDQLLAGAPFDLLVNLTNMQEHGRLNRLALLAGKHVWSEKPMANTYREGRALLELAIQKKRRIWGAPAVVQSPQFAFMAQAIRDGKLGKVSAAHAHYGHLGPDWSAFFYEKGGGSLPDLGVYNLATLTGLLGPAKAVMAMTSIVTPTRHTTDKGTVPVVAEDNAMVLLDHGNGVLSHVQCGFNYFDPYGHEGKGQEKPTITVWGTKGNLALIGYDWAPFGVDMATTENEKGDRFATDTRDYRWEMGASVIAESLATGKEPLIQPEHALHVLDIIEAARKSGTTGQRVALQSTFKWPVV
ncbi:Gfo/Idh/MocA family oxidoreductase [Fibrella sp. HMF5335]|uniref:Gfo/Idh/MocA family oxidoreductase n=1 Tax=Fibrella rubiginis TaxID=2817060 RepID=A0A939K631_9BACT|nr:Gfo/Idh/MocA family oxidoreductase [Fibrella rubiginis]MBO0938408.1 Gfo/Idh/MocA family oxidoreductase [Fibrella rubiginis]